jgi:hypothetical protein
MVPAREHHPGRRRARGGAGLPWRSTAAYSPFPDRPVLKPSSLPLEYLARCRSLRLTVYAIVTAGSLASAAPASGQVSSVYTPIDEKGCRTVSTHPMTGASSHRCQGVRGFSLVVHYDDDRASVDVHTPAGEDHRLEFWSVVTWAFSSLGPRAEWRIRRGSVRALIVRVNASEDLARPGPSRSYLVVARPHRGRWCVTDRIPPSANANVLARRAADAAGDRACLPPRS